MYSAYIREVTLKRFFQWIVDAVSNYATTLLGKDRQLWPAGLRNIDHNPLSASVPKVVGDRRWSPWTRAAPNSMPLKGRGPM
jgi:hypothetical protein